MLYQRKRRSDINVELSPLIDVVFLLLIFFMVSTTFKDEKGMDLNLPTATSESKAGDSAITLAVDAQGLLLLNGETITKDDLDKSLKRILDDREDKMIVLKIDESVSHGLVVEMMDAAKASGATGLTFAARPGKKQP